MSSAGPGIHTGFWIDHSRGVVLGGTLTYRQDAGAQLISAATIMVSLIGASVWAVSAFFLHQDGVSRGLQDEYDAQKQVILRNGASPVGTVAAYYNMGRTWHNRTRNAWKRSILHMLPPLLIFVAFTIAGVFVGKIAENPDNSRVLLKPNPCGTIVTTNNSSAASLKSSQLYSNISQIADAYARACYARSTSDSISCSSYATPRIAYTKTSDARCPIGDGNCEVTDGQALSLRASQIDSHQDLGINAPVADRIQLGYNVTCAPVSHRLMDSLIYRNDSGGLRDRQTNYSSLDFQIGPDITNGFDVAYTYNQAVQVFGLGVTGYSIRTFSSPYPHRGGGSWLPVAPFNSSNTDIVLYVIAPNGIVYSSPNQDPLFATVNRTVSDDVPFYLPRFDFRSMICTEEYRICKDSGKTCTPSTPKYSLLEEADKLQLNPKQNATWYRIAEAIFNSGMFLATPTSASLRASDYLLAGAPTSAGLPNDQWTVEAEGLFQAVLARMQYISQTFAVLPSFFLDQAEEIGLVIVEPETPELQALCTKQRIQTPPGYTSYNVFALVFIFIITLIAIGIHIFINQYGHKLPGRFPGGRNYYKLLSYQADGMLQLHRMALEGAGLGGWRSGAGARKDIPYTEHGQNRIPPPIVEHKIQSRANTQRMEAENTNDGDETSSWDDGLLYYEKAVQEDDSDGPKVRPR